MTGEESQTALATLSHTLYFLDHPAGILRTPY